MENEFELDFNTEYYEFIDYKQSSYYFYMLSEYQDEVYILLDHSHVINGDVTNTGTVKELCCFQVKNICQINIEPNDVKFWFLEDELNKLILHYVACIQEPINENWVKLKELKKIDLHPKNLDNIKKLYKYVTRDELFK